MMLNARPALDMAGTICDPDGSPEVLYRTRRTLISRVRLPGSNESIICKKPLGADAAARLRHESRILERLGTIEGVPHLASATHVEGSLAMQDVGGVPLSTVLQNQRLDRSEVLDIAIELAHVVAAMHGRGVLHKDLNPANILLVGAERRVSLIDFELATTYTQERPNFTHHKQIAGTLPYLAPEQTGRWGRLVDQRSDLYALGVTLYELATGRLPFEELDPLELIHDHLVRMPRTPASLEPDMPSALSAIIMRLLEKEPDRRYQGAEGLACDLIRLKAALARGSGETFPLGEHDFPSILLAPSRLVGRETERATLRDAFESASHTPRRAVFVTGPPGVGKTVLVESLRTVATEHRGWFVKGKFDQVQQGAAGLRQALSALGRLLLAESEEELAAHRVRVARALGTRAGHLTDLIPEFALILGSSIQDNPSEPLEAEAQIRQSILDLFRAVASPARPLVVFLDDVQWAGPNALRLIDAVVADDVLRGLLIVGSYRDAEVTENHPLARTFARWTSLGRPPQLLHLLNLEPADLSALLAEILRLPPQPSARLAAAIGSRTAGNPFDTVEFINALRRDGVLVPGDNGWTWDDAKIRRYVGGNAVVDLLAVRIARLANDQRNVLSVIACLGGDVELAALQVALAADSASVIDRLEAPLEDGLLLIEREGTVRFSHDRVQQAAYESIGEPERAKLHLSNGRRLAAVERLSFQAAEQYALAIDLVSDPGEAGMVVGLFARAAGIARLSTSYTDVERFLAAAICLLEGIAPTSDRALFNQLQSERHAALYSLARYDDADAVYRSIEQNDPDMLLLGTTACVQVCSLANRGRQRDALTVGLDLLAQLGMHDPGSEMASQVERGLDALQAWIDADMPTPVRVDTFIEDAKLLVAARLAARIMPSAFFCDPTVSFWLGLQRQRLWLENGCRAVLAPGLVGNAIALIGLRKDFRRAYRLARYARAAVEGTSEPDASRTRHTFAVLVAHWGEPLDHTIAYAQQARGGLSEAGDVQFACYTYFASLPALLDCAPSLDGVLDEVGSAIAFATRTNSVHVTAAYSSYRTLALVLQGKDKAPGENTNTALYARALADDVDPSSITTAIRHINLAVGAAIFDDREALVEHTAAAMPILPTGFYITALGHVLRALALTLQVRVRMAAGLACDDELRELDTRIEWIDCRASDAPANFGHLARFVQAERAWALGQLASAAAAFDLALRETDSLARPWQRALISERAGCFFIETGLERAAGRALIHEARDRYDEWGAAAKVAQLAARYSFLRAVASETSLDARQTTIASPDSIDLLTILRVSQALSSETSLDRLRTRIVESLGVMTGASKVHVAIFDDRQQRWFVSVGSGIGKSLLVEDAAARGSFPLSAFRYVERTREPLLVENATKDDRFATDPYLARLERCSLLVVPILSQGALRAVIVLENKLSAGTFTTDRLDAVTLLAGQLAVSLGNASLYASLEDKVTERTEALQVANRRLETLSITDPLTGLANRRRFVDYLDNEWKRALRDHKPISIAIADIDHFKRYNDRYGHLGGDACLQLVATTMARQARQGIDLVARYGGEEFGIILPGAGADETRSVIERVRSSVAALAQPNELDEGGIVTVSIGAATIVPQNTNTAQQLIGAADASLYRAKANGRNRIWTEADDALQTSEPEKGA